MMADMINNSSATDAPPREHHRLKCPRCDSSNTKFCYYNNYSLSQPRHFCKACKRYWTRGGTLRNVPVGGGCRKNKRAKKAAASSSSSRRDPSPRVPAARNDFDLLFYPLSSGALNFPGYIQDLQQPHYPQSGFNPEPHHAALLDDYPLFGSSASLLVSGLNQPKKLDDYQFLLQPYNELQVSGDLEMMIKNVKVEGDANATDTCSIDWQMPCMNESSFNVGPGDSSFHYWNPAVGGLGHQYDLAQNY